MSKLYVIFDGFRLQLGFRHAFRAPFHWTALRHTRNVFADAVRHSSQMYFGELNTLFVSGKAGDGTPLGEVRDRAILDELALQPTALDLQRVAWPIDIRLEELRADANGDARQPPECDERMVGRIDLAEEGDHIAICTIDGDNMKNASGEPVPGIAAALSRARVDRDVETWLFTLSGFGTPGRNLLSAIPEERRFDCSLSSVDGHPWLSIKRPGTKEETFSRQLDLGWADKFDGTREPGEMKSQTSTTKRGSNSLFSRPQALVG